MIVGIYGISGVGKTTFTKKLQDRYPNILRFSASELISKFDGVVDYDHLKGDTIIENQLKLIKAMDFMSNGEHVTDLVVELHNVIETKEGLIFIDKSFLKKLRLDMAYFIKKDPELIYANRVGDMKKRNYAEIEEINNIQNKSLSYFMEIYSDMGGVIINGIDEDINCFSESFDKYQC